MSDERVSFRITDSNGSRFIVEERIDTFRIGVETRAGSVNYFYASPEQYELFIQSEAKRLSQPSTT